jgi:hypothetical protein
MRNAKCEACTQMISKFGQGVVVVFADVRELEINLKIRLST